MTCEINDERAPRFTEGATVLVRYPLPGADDHDRSTWAWLPGTIVSQCCPDEWYVVVEAHELAEPDASLANGDAPENLLYSTCFRDSSEIRAITVEQWTCAREAGGR